MVGRLPGSVKTAGSGRKRGSIDLAERRLLTSEMAADLMATYKALGGRKWLLQFAKDNPSEFLRQGLSRLFPAPQRDDPDILVNQLNLGQIDEFEAARRVAFLLSAGMQQIQQPIDAEPYHSAPTPQEACALPEDRERQEFFRQQQLTPEEKLVEETLNSNLHGSLATYRGTAAEQGAASRPARTTANKESVREKAKRRLL